MKQKHANRPNWERVIKKRYFQEYVHSEEFEGYITYLMLDKVKEPLWVRYEQSDEDPICIVDNNYSWIMLFPTDAKYSLTVMVNEKDEVIQWYFDMIKAMELTDKGIPFIHDLYLDYILLPNGKLYTKDLDELQEAYSQGYITDEDYALAIHEGEQLHHHIKANNHELIHNIQKYIQRLNKYR